MSLEMQFIFSTLIFIITEIFNKHLFFLICIDRII